MTTAQENEYLSLSAALSVDSIDIDENSIIFDVEHEDGDLYTVEMNAEEVCSCMSSMNPMNDHEYQPEDLKDSECHDLAVQAANDILQSMVLNMSIPYFTSILPK